MESNSPRNKRLAFLLTAVFFLAMIMGAGPGVWLVNGKGPVLGLPAVYLWAVAWFCLQAGAVVAAYFTIWKKP